MSASSALFSGDNDMNEDTLRETEFYKNASLTPKQMKVMPVVVINLETSHVYVNSSTGSFKKNIYVGLLQERMDETGQKIADFEEFAPCSEVSTQDGFLDYDYTNTYTSDVIIPTLDDRLLPQDSND